MVKYPARFPLAAQMQGAVVKRSMLLGLPLGPSWILDYYLDLPFMHIFFVLLLFMHGSYMFYCVM